MMENGTTNGLAVYVVAWPDGSQHVALHMPDFDQMVTFDAESARTLAFMLMECSDFLQPPFSEQND